MADPNSIWLKDYGLVFACLPKVANTSVKLALREALDGPGIKRPLHAPHGFPYVDGHQIADIRQRFPGTRVVAIVRHPLDRLVSCWAQKVVEEGHAHVLQSLQIEKGATFDAFVRAVARTPDARANDHYRSQHWRLAVGERSLITDLFRFEQIDLAWLRIQRLAGERGLRLPALTHANRSARTDWPGYYNRELRALAAQRYAIDLERFGYAA